MSVNVNESACEHRQRGTTLLEFALVIILFLTMFFGIIDFARALYTYHFVTNAAREATRFAIVRGSSCSAPLVPCNAQQPDILTFVQGITPSGIKSANVAVNPSWPGIGPGTGANGGCNTTNGQSNNPGCLVQVQVTYPFNFIFPFMPSGSCMVGSGSQAVTANICMSSTSEMVISQ